MVSTKLVLAFDLYGTLLSTASIAKALAKHLGDDEGAAVAATWRTLQLEYTWRLNSMRTLSPISPTMQTVTPTLDKYLPFDVVTMRALSHALAAHHHTLEQPQLNHLLQAYDDLDTFPDAAPALAALGQSATFQCIVFSNGTPGMLAHAMERKLAPHAAVFADVVSVDAIRRYKPDPAAYRLLTERVGRVGRAEEVWLVSGNPFDVVGARASGLRAVWVDNQATGWVDNLGGEAEGPTVVVESLDQVEHKIEAWLRENPDRRK